MCELNECFMTVNTPYKINVTLFYFCIAERSVCFVKFLNIVKIQCLSAEKLLKNY